MRIFKKDEELSLPSEVEELRQNVLSSAMPALVEKVALKEVERLSKSAPCSAEYTIGVNYIDYLLSLPWNNMTEDRLDLKRAEAVLTEEHYGLEEIKDRILEHLAVRILKLSRKLSILVVDDEKATLLNLEHVLAKEGYEVLTAGTGSEALHLLEKRPFDLILTDLKMEKIDGMQVLERAKAVDPSMEVIVITGYATIPSAVEATKRGAYQYLSKPFRLDEVRSTVHNALRSKKLQLESRGPILCFVGPPGTGKTSLGKSISRSLGRKFVRISLAGMKDEAEIRGHRRSYVGAMPGRIIQEIRRAESRNPVFMLDEIDKIGQDFKGDPSSALLEVFDPEQNSAFMDHYLDVPFDLSRVMFITTANSVDPIPPPLLDRFEVLHLPGYTEEEKEKIAFGHLIPREIREAALSEGPPVFTPEAVRKIIREYTRESGLRGLQRQIAAVCRKLARDFLEKGRPGGERRMVGPELVEALLGPRRYSIEVAQARERVGTATGVAWTETGGEIIFVEATRMKGKGELILTGSLGDVMKESAQAAVSYVRSHHEMFGLPETSLEDTDIHIHVPAGAIRKDGPSAGVTIAVALISLLASRPCHRDVALTGELTLSGRVLAVGGVRTKVLAAQRAGIATVVFPARNEPDLKEIPEDIKRQIRIVMVHELQEAVALALR